MMGLISIAQLIMLLFNYLGNLVTCGFLILSDGTPSIFHILEDVAFISPCLKCDAPKANDLFRVFSL